MKKPANATPTESPVTTLKASLSDAVRAASKAGLSPRDVASIVTDFAEQIDREADNVIAMQMGSYMSTGPRP